MVANTRAEEVLAQFSPDGRWVAYQTNESGRFEVVVQPFPDAGGKWQVSTAGGVAPRWRAAGKELYFVAPDATLMDVPVTAAGASFASGTPVALFPARILEGGSVAIGHPQYAVARDGRFLINHPRLWDVGTPARGFPKIVPMVTSHRLEHEPTTGRPYFLWWTDLSEATFSLRLGDPDLTVRAYWLGALLREANTRDVWRYTTPATIRAQWPQVVRHLGRTRAMWAWLLRIDPGDQAWPPSTVA